MQFDIRMAMKAAQWEIAKGHLRSLAMIDGAISSGDGLIAALESERPYRFERVSNCVEAFIKEFEETGLHE